MLEQITEVRDFAGKDIEIKKLVDADSREAIEKAKAAGAAPSALDHILEQIKKKQKLSVLDKTKKDWGEFKEENKGMEEELDQYKKSSNKYLDKVSFLQRADYREFERERDARLSMMSKRKSDTPEDWCVEGLKKEKKSSIILQLLVDILFRWSWEHHFVYAFSSVSICWFNVNEEEEDAVHIDTGCIHFLYVLFMYASLGSNFWRS